MMHYNGENNKIPKIKNKLDEIYLLSCKVGKLLKESYKILNENDNPIKKEDDILKREVIEK